MKKKKFLAKVIAGLVAVSTVVMPVCAMGIVGMEAETQAISGESETFKNEQELLTEAFTEAADPSFESEESETAFSEIQTEANVLETSMEALSERQEEPSELLPDTEGLQTEPETEELPGTEWSSDTETEPLTDSEYESGTDEFWDNWQEDMDTEQEWETDYGEDTESTDIEGASDEATEMDGVPVLADTNGNVEIDIYAPEGERFPMGTTLRLLSIWDVIGETENEQEQREALESLLKDAWEDSLLESMRNFLPYYIMLTDSEGKEIRLSEPASIHLKICDKAFYEDAKERNDTYYVAFQGKGDVFLELEDRQVIRDDDECSVSFVFSFDQFGWFSVLQAQTEEEVLEEQEDDYLVSYASLAPSGNKVTASGSGFVKMSSANMDGSYRPARWYDDISAFEPFNSAGNDVKTLTVDSGGGAYVFYPVNKNAKGKFGGIYKKILYKDGQWYDLMITVTDYSNKTYAGTAGDAVDSYPPIGFSTTGIRWRFSPAMGEYTLKLQFYNSNDAARTPVKLNTRFQWWEIDNSQRFGIRVGDGTISAQYYQSGNCIVHYKTQESVDGNNYLFLTAAEEASSEDAKGNVGFSLAGCSTYYMAIGYRDHIKEDADYRASKAKIQEWNENLSKGTTGDLTLGMLVQSDVDVPVPPDNSYPQKFTSNDAASWSAANTLPAINAEFYYKISQYVPWQTATNYYSSFSIQDPLPAGVDYVGGLSVRRVEDNKDMTSKFTCSADNDTVVISPTANFIGKSGFYGYTFEAVFKVRMDPTEIPAAYSGNTASYQVTNKASVNMAFPNNGGNYTNESNTVSTAASVSRNVQDAPRKRLDANENLTTKDLGTLEDTIMFSIYQNIPVNDAAWLPSQVNFTDTLADCLEFKTAKVYQMGQGGYAESEGWTATASGQTVSVSKAFSPSNTALRFDITCGIRAGYDLEKYIQVVGNRRWYVIPNTAEVELVWGNGSPPSVKNVTNEATVRAYAGLVTAHLFLTKEIQAADIVWAHGNPVFTFKVEGEDADGVEHTYYETVEFTPSNTGNTDRATLTADIEVPAGWYTAVEEKTMRYQLSSIHSVSGGSATGDTAVFDVSQGGNASAVFFNVKTTDTGESHTAFVRNTIG